jgi:hypothetical protein
MTSKMIKILDPTARTKVDDTGLAPRVSGLGGSTLGIVSNVWRSFDVIAEHLGEVSRDRYEVREVMRTINPHISSPITEDTLNMLVAKADAAIVGMGH